MYWSIILFWVLLHVRFFLGFSCLVSFFLLLYIPVYKITLLVPASMCLLVKSRIFYIHIRHLSFLEISSRHCQSQTGRARDLKFLENVHPPPCITCHMSHAICHMSQVTCHVSHVTCQVLCVTCIFLYIYIFFFEEMVELVGQGFVINRAYPI